MAHFTLISIGIADLLSRFTTAKSSAGILTIAFVLAGVFTYLWTLDEELKNPECLPPGGMNDAEVVRQWVIDYTVHRQASGQFLGWPRKEEVSKLSSIDLRDISEELLYDGVGFWLLYSVEIGGIPWRVSLNGEAECKFRLSWYRQP